MKRLQEHRQTRRRLTKARAMQLRELGRHDRCGAPLPGNMGIKLISAFDVKLAMMAPPLEVRRALDNDMATAEEYLRSLYPLRRVQTKAGELYAMLHTSAPGETGAQTTRERVYLDRNPGNFRVL